MINRIKKEFSDTRVIFVADRGLNTSDNIYYLNGDNKGEEIRFMHKFRIHPKGIQVNVSVPGSKKKKKKAVKSTRNKWSIIPRNTQRNNGWIVRL